MTGTPSPHAPPPHAPAMLLAPLPLSADRERAVRAAIVREALTWVGTPYAHQGAVKGGAVDCAMLLVTVFVAAGVFAPFDPRPYAQQWNLHHNEERYLGWLTASGTEVTAPRFGDVVVWQFGRCYSHAGIIINSRLHVVHALAQAGKCTITDMTESMLSFTGKSGTPRPRKYFDVLASVRAPVRVPAHPAKRKVA